MQRETVLGAVAASSYAATEERFLEAIRIGKESREQVRHLQALTEFWVERTSVRHDN